MYPKYTRKSIRNSLTNAEKIIVENVKNVINKNQRKKLSEKIRKLAKAWDKFIYTFCILFNYFTYVSYSLFCFDHDHEILPSYFKGICSCLFAPAMVDMMFLFRTSMANINYANTFNAIGYLTGSLCKFA